MSITHIKPEPIRLKPYLLIYSYKNGDSYTLHATYDAAMDTVRETCRQYLEDYRSDPAERAAMAKLIDDDTLEVYEIFDAWNTYTCERESFQLEMLELVL